MLNILNATEMRAADRFTIDTVKIPGLILMENAGLSVFRAMEQELGDLAVRPVMVFCGKGNNGGDGFVLARHLRNHGYPTRVLLLGGADGLPPDAATNHRALVNMGVAVEEVLGEDAFRTVRRGVDPSMIFVDAILGTGLSSPARGFLKDVIDWMNSMPNVVVAVDVPSGLSADTGEILGSAVESTLTVTFAALKHCHVFPPGALLCGKTLVADISIPRSALERAGSRLFLVEEKDAMGLLQPRRSDSNKGDYGHVLVVAGSEGKTGAAVLAGSAAVRCGAGLVTAAVPGRCLPVVASGRAEYMTEALPETERGSLALAAAGPVRALLGGKTCVAVGPGLSTHEDTVRFTRELVRTCPVPMVIDADGLNAFAGDTADLKGTAERPVIITPHPGEMARLLGRSVPEILKDRAGIARSFSNDHGVITVLKGMRTLVAVPGGGVFVNPTGNPGMASGGTGDVLTGMVAALLGRGLDPGLAAWLGVFLHGRAGDLAARDVGEEALCAGDIIDAIPRAFASLDPGLDPGLGPGDIAEPE